MTCRACSASRHGDDRKSTLVKNGSRPESGARVRPNNWGYSTYLDAVFSLSCFNDLMRVGALSSAKDISESYGALQAIKQHSAAGGSWKDDSVVCLCVGDGSAPRTASLACYLTKWRCVSIDPELKEEWVGNEARGVKRLVGFRGTIDDYMSTQERIADAQKLAIICVHSHARFVGPSAVPNIRARFGDLPTCVVAIPCCPRVCPERDVGVKPHTSYYDDCIFSEKRRVEIWNFDGPSRPKVCGECADAKRRKSD